jgi:hypothetical protein
VRGRNPVAGDVRSGSRSSDDNGSRSSAVANSVLIRVFMFYKLAFATTSLAIAQAGPAALPLQPVTAHILPSK